MAVASDIVAGSITLTNGVAAFTTSGVNMQTRGVLPGWQILLDTLGLVLTINTVTGENAGTLTNLCPSAATGTFTVGNWRIRPQSDGSAVTAKARNLIDALNAQGAVAFSLMGGSL